MNRLVLVASNTQKITFFVMLALLPLTLLFEPHKGRYWTDPQHPYQAILVIIGLSALYWHFCVFWFMLSPIDPEAAQTSCYNPVLR